MQTPLVSIIIPTYNRAHLIGETLDSILAQTYTNWECIVNYTRTIVLEN
ncbi:glycosyltransferase family 2 protein [Lutibacter profundi]|nr:glycosyltransferase [Lutibacter profundi]